MARPMTPEQREAWGVFVQEVGEYLYVVEGSPHAVARLVREAAVAAFVSGMYVGGGRWQDPRTPSDSKIVDMTRETARSSPDLYPAWGIFEGNTDGHV